MAHSTWSWMAQTYLFVRHIKQSITTKNSSEQAHRNNDERQQRPSSFHFSLHHPSIATNRRHSYSQYKDLQNVNLRQAEFIMAQQLNMEQLQTVLSQTLSPDSNTRKTGKIRPRFFKYPCTLMIYRLLCCTNAPTIKCP